MEITKHERNFCQFHLTNPTRPGHCQSALAIPETTIDKKRPGTVVCGYRKVPATDRLTGFATAAPRTPERTRAPVAQGSWLSTVRRGHRRTVWRPTVMTPTGCEASPQFTLIDTGRGWVSLLRCAWYEHSGETVDYTCSTKSQSPMQHAIWHIGN